MAIDQTNLILGLEYPGWGEIFVGLSLIGATVGWIVDRSKERKLRREEIKWRRTEFIFEQASLFDGDNEVSDAVKIITGNNVDVSVESLLDLKSDMKLSERGDGRHKLDKLLNLMERIAFAFDKDVLAIEEVAHFEWYFVRVMEIKVLNNYCEEYYPAILEAAKQLRKQSS